MSCATATVTAVPILAEIPSDGNSFIDSRALRAKPYGWWNASKLNYTNTLCTILMFKNYSLHLTLPERLLSYLSRYDKIITFMIKVN